MKQQIERNRDCLAYMMANVEEEIKDMINDYFTERWDTRQERLDEQLKILKEEIDLQIRDRVQQIVQIVEMDLKDKGLIDTGLFVEKAKVLDQKLDWVRIQLIKVKRHESELMTEKENVIKNVVNFLNQKDYQSFVESPDENVRASIAKMF